MNRLAWVIIAVVLFSVCGCNLFTSGKKLINTTGPFYVETCYVDGLTGDDKNPGTDEKPIKTLIELNIRILNKPVSVYLAGGQTFEGTLVLNGMDGDKANPLIISSWGNGMATINGGNNEAVKIENCEYLTLTNMNLKGNGRKTGNTTNGLSVVRSRNCKIKYINAEGFQKSGIELFDCTNSDVLNIRAKDNGFSGINIIGSRRGLSHNIIIKDCYAENNAGDPTMLDNHSGNGILVGVSDSVTIDHCSATNNGWDMPRIGNGPVGIWAWESGYITIQYCISYRNKTSEGGKDGGGFDLDGGVTNSILQYCLSYENQGAGYGLFQYSGASPWSGNIVRYCVSVEDGKKTEGSGSFFIWNGSGDSSQLTECMIYNNVVYNSSGPALSYENASEHKGFIFSNNIFLGSGQLISGNEKGSSFRGNVWWSANGNIQFTKYSNMAEWARATGQEMLNGSLLGKQVDPLLKGPFNTTIIDPYMLNTLFGYTLQSESPVNGKGQDIQSLFGKKYVVTDFYGNSVPSGTGTEPGVCEIK